jgi:hypothetical protein
VAECDHIAESRFFINNPHFSGSMDMVENGLALPVPRNAEMLGWLRERDPQLLVPYTHADKRPPMQRLPDGREAEFPLQAVWDCHVDTYNQLGVKITPYANSLGALVHQDLVFNLGMLANDMRQQAVIYRKLGFRSGRRNSNALRGARSGSIRGTGHSERAGSTTPSGSASPTPDPPDWRQVPLVAETVEWLRHADSGPGNQGLCD